MMQTQGPKYMQQLTNEGDFQRFHTYVQVEICVNNSFNLNLLQLSRSYVRK